jgi:hypothetical protein
MLPKYGFSKTLNQIATWMIVSRSAPFVHGLPQRGVVYK